MIERNAQTDLAVAKAAGVKYVWRFHPTTNLIDAWEAAEKVAKKTESSICIRWLQGAQIWIASISVWRGEADTPELAICEAILAITKAKVNRD